VTHAWIIVHTPFSSTFSHTTHIPGPRSVRMILPLDDRLLFMTNALLCTINLLPHARHNTQHPTHVYFYQLTSGGPHIYHVISFTPVASAILRLLTLMYMLWTVEVFCPFFLHPSGRLDTGILSLTCPWICRVLLASYRWVCLRCFMTRRNQR